MGGFMPYSRLVYRNNLTGDYDNEERFEPLPNLGCIRGDMRRFERDSRDPLNLALYAQKAGVTVEQVKSVIDALLDEESLQFPDGFMTKPR